MPANLTIANTSLASRLMLGTSGYPSPAVLANCVAAATPGFVTVALRRAGGHGSAFYDLVAGLGVPLVPNTAGCRTAKEACVTAHLARELLGTDWVKLEVIADDDTLAPDPFELTIAAEKLLADGFKVLAYCTEDLALCRRLANMGCHAIMPWGAPIGSGQGLVATAALARLRDRLPDSVLIIDAGLGRPSDAAQAMELGYDGVLLNTAVAKAREPVTMAGAFAQAVTAGRSGYTAGIIPRLAMAHPSTPAPDAPLAEFIPGSRP